VATPLISVQCINQKFWVNFCRLVSLNQMSLLFCQFV